MNTKRWSVWFGLLALALGLRETRAQEVDPLLVDDLPSKPTVKAVKDLPQPANLGSPAKIQIDFVMWDVDGKKLATILSESKEPVLEFIRHNGIEIPGKRGPEPLVHVLRKPLKFDVGGKDVSSAFKKLTAPTVVTLSGQEATMLSGGEFPVPVPTNAIGSRKVVMREFGQKFVAKPVLLNDGKIYIDVTAEDSRLSEPVVSVDDVQVPSIFSRRVSAACNLQPGETLIFLNGPTESALMQLVEVTPRLANDPKPVILASPPKTVPPVPQATAGKTQSHPKPRNDAKPVGVLKGKGISSDAGVTGKIALEDKEVGTKLEASSLTIDVPKVVNLGVEIGQTGALLERDSPENHLRLIAPSVVLEDTKGPKQAEEGLFSATVTLRLTSNATIESVRDLKPEADQKLFLVPLPEGHRTLEKSQAQRIFEHAFLRALANDEHLGGEEWPIFIAEITQGQKVVRVPVKHAAYLLLPTPSGHFAGFDYVATARSEKPAAKRVSDLTVLFVSNSVFELESLIEELEPTAKVTAIEVRDAVVLRGTVTEEAQRKSLIEIAEQFYPKVLDQLKVRAIAADLTRNLPDGGRVLVNPTKAEMVQHVSAESHDRDVVAPARRSTTPSSVAPNKLPSLEELRQLRDDVKGLRQDVQRLSEQLELADKATHQANADQQDPLSKKISLHLEQVPLAEFLKLIAKNCAINVSLDERGLAEEGISAEKPVNVNLDHVSAATALKLVLDPLGLTVKTEAEGVLVVTSRVRSKGELVTKVYAVADLVVPLPKPTITNESKTDAKSKYASQVLIDLISTTIAPHDWEQVGGIGSMQFNSATLSLVIRTTANVHQEIAELLSQLRRLQDIQVTLEMSLISVQDDLIPREINGSSDVSSLVLNQTAKQSFVEKWQNDRRTNILMAPKVTLFNGQTASLNSDALGSAEHPIRLVLNGVASADRKSVRLALGINGESFETAVRQQQETLQVGQSLILDVTDDLSTSAVLLKKLPVAADSDEARNIFKKLKPKDRNHVLLLVTPRIIVQEEEAATPARSQPVPKSEF